MMYSPPRLIRFAAAAASAIALTGCAPMRVDAFVERGANFPQYRTYAWAPADSLSTGDPRLDNNRFFQDRIESDVEKELTARGFEKTARGTPDLVIHYHASIDRQLDVNGLDKQNGYCQAGNCEPYVYEEGSLVIDLVDSRGKLVWRGWAVGAVDGAINRQSFMETSVDKAVTRILAKLPKRL